MLYEAKSLLNLPIINLDSGKTLAWLSDIIIDPENGKVLGLVATLGFWVKTKKAVAFSDIYEFGPEAILVRDDESLINISNIVRIKKIIDQKIFILGSKVVTKSGKRLGRVKNFVVNTDLGILVKIYVESLWGKSFIKGTLVIPAARIISIERKKIIISDELLKEKAEEEERVGETAVAQM
jgi:uncharacterized protein YrrD